MISLIMGLAIVMFMLWLGFTLTGAVLAAIIWLFIRLPLALTAWVIGLVLCCTIILIPLGILFFKGGLKLIVPGCIA